MRSQRAFTLPELLIGVTVSAIVMVGVSVFVASGIGDAFRIRKTIDDNRESLEFETELNRMTAFWGEPVFSGGLESPFGKGIVLKNSRLPFPITVLATRSATGVCESFSGKVEIPAWLERLSLLRMSSPEGVRSAWGYSVDHAGHVIRNAAGNVVVGTGNPGSKGGDGLAGTATELRYPTAIAKIANGKYLIADTGNDRVLFFDGTNVTTFVSSDSGVRHPYSIVTDGTDVRIAGSDGILGILGNPVETGESFRMNRRADKPFSYDSIKISLWGGREAPTSMGDYEFDFTDPGAQFSASWSEAVFSFSGAARSYARNDPMRVLVSGIGTPPAATGAYQGTVTYFSGTTTVHERMERYFTVADGDPLTLADDAFEKTWAFAKLPANLSFSGGTFGFADFSDYPNIANSGTVSERYDSTRIVENFRTESDGKVLTVKFVEYVRFDCLWWSHVRRERTYKIPVR